MEVARKPCYRSWIDSKEGWKDCLRASHICSNCASSLPQPTVSECVHHCSLYTTLHLLLCFYALTAYVHVLKAFRKCFWCCCKWCFCECCGGFLYLRILWSWLWWWCWITRNKGSYLRTSIRGGVCTRGSREDSGHEILITHKASHVPNLALHIISQFRRNTQTASPSAVPGATACLWYACNSTHVSTRTLRSLHLFYILYLSVCGNISFICIASHPFWSILDFLTWNFWSRDCRFTSKVNISMRP